MNRFDNLDFEGFRRLAKAEGLSRYERIGFPDAYREGYEAAIFADILSKLPALTRTQTTVLDIGPGCSELPEMLIRHCEAKEQRLFLLDSQEMLDLLPDSPAATKLTGRFPMQSSALDALRGQVDALISYSVLQYVFVDANPFLFLDEALALLAPGGRFLIGDIPNVSMRRRFFSSQAGVEFHKSFTGSDEEPTVRFNTLESGEIDDAALCALLSRARAAGFHAYVLPQGADLPMANRREDMMIERP